MNWCIDDTWISIKHISIYLHITWSIYSLYSCNISIFIYLKSLIIHSVSLPCYCIGVRWKVMLLNCVLLLFNLLDLIQQVHVYNTLTDIQFINVHSNISRHRATWYFSTSTQWILMYKYSVNTHMYKYSVNTHVQVLSESDMGWSTLVLVLKYT